MRVHAGEAERRDQEAHERQRVETGEVVDEALIRLPDGREPLELRVARVRHGGKKAPGESATIAATPTVPTTAARTGRETGVAGRNAAAARCTRPDEARGDGDHDHPARRGLDRDERGDRDAGRAEQHERDDQRELTLGPRAPEAAEHHDGRDQRPERRDRLEHDPQLGREVRELEPVHRGEERRHDGGEEHDGAAK